MANVKVQSTDTLLSNVAKSQAPRQSGTAKLSGPSFGQTLKSLAKPKDDGPPAAAPAAPQTAKNTTDAGKTKNDSSGSGDSLKSATPAKAVRPNAKKGTGKPQPAADDTADTTSDPTSTSNATAAKTTSDAGTDATDSSDSTDPSNPADTVAATTGDAAATATAAQQAALVNTPVPAAKPVSPMPDLPTKAGPPKDRQPVTAVPTNNRTSTPTTPIDPSATATPGDPTAAADANQDASSDQTNDGNTDATAQLASDLVGPTQDIATTAKPAIGGTKKPAGDSSRLLNGAPVLAPAVNNPLAAAASLTTPTLQTANSESAATTDSDDDSSPVGKIDPAASDPTAAADPTALLNPAPQPHAASATAQAAAVAQPTRTAADVAASNHDKIITAVRGELNPNGGTMKIRLDPPELGSLQITVKMVNGAMTASFETSNASATQMLSHSLGQLKTALESTGVSVEKLHVTQTSGTSSSNKSDSGSNSGKGDDSRQQAADGDGGMAQREQQRREMIRRMWAKLGVGDPLDMVA